MKENLPRVIKEQLGDKPSFIDFSGLLDNERVIIKGMDEMSKPFNESLNGSPLQWSENWADNLFTTSMAAIAPPAAPAIFDVSSFDRGP